MVSKKSIYLAGLTSLISGVSIFLNSNFVVKLVKDPFVLTSMRNLIVAVFFSSVLVGVAKWVKLKELTTKQWLQLIVIGIIGGSIPFLLFFKGLAISQAAAVNGAFIHKTLFIWVAVLAIIFLKEKLSFWQLGAFGVILAGLYLAGGPKNWLWGEGEKLVLIAVLFWSLETIVAKIVLVKIPAIVVSWGRMFFGSLIMLGYLWQTNRLGIIETLSPNQWVWIIGTGLLLFGYVTLWFTALKNAPATVVTSILTLGFPVTVILNLIFVSHKIDLRQAIGLILMIAAAYLVVKAPSRHYELKQQSVHV